MSIYYYRWQVLLSLLFVVQLGVAHEPNQNNYGNQSQTNAVNQVSITSDGTYRYITSNGIPYSHGQFPNAHNPNTVSAQTYNFKVPLNPRATNRAIPLSNGMDFGVAIDGVPFDPGTAETWNNDPNWRYEALSGKIDLGMDFNNAHVQSNGAYHYHGLPTEVMSGLSSSLHSGIVGYAADGFPIYALYGYSSPMDPNSTIKQLSSSYKLRQGTRTSGPGGTYDGTFTQDYVYVKGSGDLDECNGRFTITPDYPQGTYAYFITNNFPIIPRCFQGTPDQSFRKQGGGGRGGNNSTTNNTQNGNTNVNQQQQQRPRMQLQRGGGAQRPPQDRVDIRSL